MLQETFQWKGVTSKKKGQKWGKEKAASSKWNNYEIFNQDYSETLTTEEEISVNDSKDLDFNKLKPYTSLPKVCFFPIFIITAWVDLSFFLRGGEKKGC